MTRMLTAEMLVLVAMTDSGHVPFGTEEFVKVGLASALLADLAIEGNLTIAGDGRVRLTGTVPGDSLLADVYSAVGTELEGEKPKRVVERLGRHIGGCWQRVIDRMVDAGALGRDRHSVFHATRHPVIDVAAQEAVLDQVRSAAAGQAPLTPQVAVVLALAVPCQLVPRVAPERGTRRAAKKRIGRATADAPFPPGVAPVIKALVAATADIAAAMTSAGAAVSYLPG